MMYGQDAIDQVRSIMAPGNPVPDDVPSDNEQEPYQHATYDRIMALAHSEKTARAQRATPGLPPGRPRPGHGCCNPGLRPARRCLFRTKPGGIVRGSLPG
jgi:hypothetical protein